MHALQSFRHMLRDRKPSSDANTPATKEAEKVGSHRKGETDNLAVPSQEATKPRSSDVDVLIIGAGPAGLMAAATLARYGVHNVRIVDKRSTKIYTGQADGLNPRSLEIFQALDMGKELHYERCELGEIAFWNPTGESGRLERTGRIPDTIPDISRYRQSTCHQGRIERMFLDKIKLWSTPEPSSTTLGTTPPPAMSVERATVPFFMNLPPLNSSGDVDAEGRITIQLRKLAEEDAQPAQFSPAASDGLFRSNLFADDVAAGDVNLDSGRAEEEVEEIRAKYVIGADGARSWTRGQLGYKLEGDSANYFWGVLDGRPITNFVRRLTHHFDQRSLLTAELQPDIRLRCAIHSADKGSVMVIPRERDLVRLYIQIPQPPTGKRPNRADVTPEKLLKHAQEIMHPYHIDIKKVEWFTCYEIGQRLADNWVWKNRIFIAGDACHTHSPKAGQGMNISMADTFNLTWKLAHVISGRAHPKILSTYQPERAQVAADLIEFDHKFSRLFSGKPQKDVFDETGISLAEFKSAFERGNTFSSGTSVDYSSTVLLARPTEQATVLAANLPVGFRFKSYPVVAISNAMSYELGDLMPADGRWRIFVFAGDVRNVTVKNRLDALGLWLGQDEKSPVVKYTPGSADRDTVIEVKTVIATPRVEVELDDFQNGLQVTHGKEGYLDYFKVFCDDASHHAPKGYVYEKYGIQEQIGAVVIVRPDQYVSVVTDLQDFDGIASFFDGFML